MNDLGYKRLQTKITSDKTVLGGNTSNGSEAGLPVW